uniref:Sensitive to high expression protein 9, mitochondrial n=1 Tax=Timspurckia oligopyrenoides TaxID=708627 RepID=A0A7S0ZHM1_9RHOD|mmetsp:Transcript_566/g.1022  ORF Transcript_566/g.1022 Transcript_566/m.1022 type:complete len:290 (+) Transcript_566:20-889(+)
MVVNKSTIVRWRELKSVTRELNQWLNELSGFSKCLELRDKVVNTSQRFLETRLQYKTLKQIHSRNVIQRTSIQSQLSTLLQRKTSWNSDDMNTFTELCRKEHEFGSIEAQSERDLQRIEQELDHSMDLALAAMRERYQEEQNWSQHVSMLSAYTSIGLLSLNVILFSVSVGIIEPRKRKLLHQQITNSFDNKIEDSHTIINEKMKQESHQIIKHVEELLRKEREFQLKMNNQNQIREISDSTASVLVIDDQKKSKLDSELKENVKLISIATSVGAFLGISLYYVINRSI